MTWSIAGAIDDRRDQGVAGGLARRNGRAGVRPEPSLTQSVKKVASHKRNPPATRTGRKGIVIYLDQNVAAAIRRLGVSGHATNQDLGEMAFKFLFEKSESRGRSRGTKNRQWPTAELRSASKSRMSEDKPLLPMPSSWPLASR